MRKEVSGVAWRDGNQYNGEKRDRLGRKRTQKSRREELVQEYRRSGLTQEAFAKREGINYTTFCSWVQETGKRRMKAVAFAQLQLPRALCAEDASPS